MPLNRSTSRSLFDTFAHLSIVSNVLPIVLGRIEAGHATDFYATKVKDSLPHSLATPEIAAVRDFLGRKGWQASLRNFVFFLNLPIIVNLSSDL